MGVCAKACGRLSDGLRQLLRSPIPSGTATSISSPFGAVIAKYSPGLTFSGQITLSIMALAIATESSRQGHRRRAAAQQHLACSGPLQLESIEFTITLGPENIDFRQNSNQ
eukprot:COSAG05_NODE_35_length_27765_cov_221.324719_13_plen_111_part_00